MHTRYLHPLHNIYWFFTGRALDDASYTGLKEPPAPINQPNMQALMLAVMLVWYLAKEAGNDEGDHQVVSARRLHDEHTGGLHTAHQQARCIRAGHMCAGFLYGIVPNRFVGALQPWTL
jgi:hypothetical protein